MKDVGHRMVNKNYILVMETGNKLKWIQILLRAMKKRK